MPTQHASASSRRPAGPPRHLRLAHYLRWRTDILEFLLQSAAKYGDVVDLSLGPTTYLLNNPEDIRHVLVHRHDAYGKARRLTSERGKAFSGEGLITSSGDPALLQRRILQPVALPTSQPDLATIVQRCALDAAADWQPGVVYDMYSEMIRLAQRIICRILFSIDVKEGSEELVEAIAIRLRYIHYAFRSRLPMPEAFPTHRNREHRKAVRYLHHFIDEAIRSRRKSLAPPRDMLTMMIESRFKDGSGMEDRLLRDEVMTVISTGFETVGASLGWCLHLLAQHPTEQDKLCAESRAVLGTRPPGVADVTKLPYTQAIYSESLRLFPPTWIFDRVANQDDVLPSGYPIRRGTKLFLSPYVTQRHPGFFPDPERFEPDRFCEAAIESRPRLAFFPFSAGPRVCLGQAIALTESVLILATLGQRVRFHSVSDHVVRPDPGQLLSAKGGIPLTVTSVASGVGGV